MSPRESREMQQLPPIDPRKLAKVAHAGAAHHLEGIRELLTSEPADEVRSEAEFRNALANDEEVNELHWRIRAFFWEMVGAFDLFLQWANEHFSLGIPVGRVKWSTVRDAEASEHEAEWDRAHELLKSTYWSDWYFEIRTYRNYAHRSFFQVTALLPKRDSGMYFLPEARDGQVPPYRDVREVLADYLKNMGQLGQELTNA